MVNNKRGWMRILEATIAVMLVSGVLVVVYSKQVDRGIAPADYFFTLQRQILADISSQADLRLAILNVEVEDETDGNFSRIYNFTRDKIPDAFGFSLQICDLGDEIDFCKLDGADIIRETMDKDVFVEDLIISSELGNGDNRAIGAKKLRFFIWELR